jgi:hypothetical protein
MNLVILQAYPTFKKQSLTVRHLTEVDIAGLAHVHAEAITTDRLRVKFGGLGDVRLSKLNAQRLDVDVTMPSPCEIEVTGQVVEQHVSLNGMGEYDAHALESRTTTVALSGPGGHAIVRAEDNLTVSITGPGRVEYYGQPRVTKRVSPLGAVTHLVDVEKAAAYRS